jgi:hypothetical protein
MSGRPNTTIEFMLERIISGGQSGVDQAGWRAARALGLAAGGWMPLGLTEAFLITVFRMVLNMPERPPPEVMGKGWYPQPF